MERRFRQYFAYQLPGNPACRKDTLERFLATLAWSVPSAGGPVNLNGLDRIVTAISGRDVAPKLVVYPQHALRVETDYLCRRAEARWHALWQLAQRLEIHPPAPPASIELWDFQGYSAYTTEPVASGLMTYWQDPEHFNYELGNVMLDWMFGAVPITESGFRRARLPGNHGDARGAAGLVRGAARSVSARALRKHSARSCLAFSLRSAGSPLDRRVITSL